MPVSIPNFLHGKAGEIPESSYGATRVTLILKDGKRIGNVVLAWGSDIVKIGEKEIGEASEIGFDTNDVADIINE